MRPLVAAVLLFVPGCVAAEGEAALAHLDREAYVTGVHPVVEPSCATLDCHGAPGRPLRIYSETGLRMRDGLRRDAEPVSPEEIDSNVLSFAAIDTDDVSLGHRLSLSKPLAETAGGVEHVGGDVWPSRSDPGYRCVALWLGGRATEPDWEAACADAVAEVGLPPP